MNPRSPPTILLSFTTSKVLNVAEKAGVGGSTPSLATIIPEDLCDSPGATLRSALSPHLEGGARSPTHTSKSLTNLS